MGETVRLSLRVGRPGKRVQVEAEPTATPGLLVCCHPEDGGWSVVTHEGWWFTQGVQWKTAEDAHAVAAGLGEDGAPDWTLTHEELLDDMPATRKVWEGVLGRFADRRLHATAEPGDGGDGEDAAHV